ncbi:MAG: hypothetical protein ACREV2_08020 [Burkholderiales bacterium]
MADPTRVVYEMAISHADFFRTLSFALNNAPYEVHGTEVVVADGEKKLTISLSAESRRSFGPIPLPVTGVELVFEGYGTQEREQFLAHFNNCYRRGGG